MLKKINIYINPGNICAHRANQCGLLASGGSRASAGRDTVWSVGRQECSVKCGVWSVKCGVWRKQWEVRSVKCGLWSVKCGLWSVKCGVGRVQCEVWSVKSAVWRAKWSFKCDMWNRTPLSQIARTHGLGWRTAHASSIDEKGLIYTYISLRQLPPRLVRVLLVNWYGTQSPWIHLTILMLGIVDMEISCALKSPKKHGLSSTNPAFGGTPILGHTHGQLAGRVPNWQLHCARRPWELLGWTGDRILGVKGWFYDPVIHGDSSAKRSVGFSWDVLGHLGRTGVYLNLWVSRV